MAIGRISGSVLKSNLTRNGTDLAFETNLLYLDVTNSRVGIGTSEPSTTFHVNGNTTLTGDLSLSGSLSPGQLGIEGNTISTTQSNADLVLDPAGTGRVVVNSELVTNIISSDDSSAIRINDSIDIAGNIVPVADDTYSLGTATAKWASLHVSGSTIFLGDLALQVEGTSNNAQFKVKKKKSGKGVLDVDPDLDYEDGSAVIQDILSIVGDDSSGTSLHSGETFKFAGTGGISTSVSGDTLTVDGSAISTNSISQGNSDITVTDTGTATVSVTTDGTNILNFTTALPIDASNSDKAIRLPNGTSGQRPAGSPGMIRYNSSTDKIEGYTTAGGWAEFGASGGGGGGGDETGDAVLGIGVNPKNVDTFTTGTYDSAFYYAVTRDETNDEVSTARYSLVHNDTNAFVAETHIVESDPTNSYVTVDADIDSGTVRLRGTGTSDINSVSFYEIPLGDNSVAGTTGNVTIFKNADVDSVAEAIDSWSLSSIRGAKYFISIKDDASGEVSNTEAIVVHDGSTAYITQYGTVNATIGNRDLITLTAEVDSSFVVVKAQGAIANCRITGYRIALGDSETGSTGDNVDVVAATTVSSSATALDTFQSDVYTGAFYIVVGYNATEGAASISEVQMVTNNGAVYIATGPTLTSKESDQLSFTAGVSGTTVTLNVASTSGSSTTVNAYRIHMLRGIGGAVSENVTVAGDQGISGIKTFTSPVVLQVSSDPSTVSNSAHIYAKDESASAEVYVRDEAGNVTKISPHNAQGEWEYYSRNTRTGKTVRINMEELVRDIEQLTGKTYIKDQ